MLTKNSKVEMNTEKSFASTLSKTINTMAAGSELATLFSR